LEQTVAHQMCAHLQTWTPASVQAKKDTSLYTWLLAFHLVAHVIQCSTSYTTPNQTRKGKAYKKEPIA